MNKNTKIKALILAPGLLIWWYTGAPYPTLTDAGGGRLNPGAVSQTSTQEQPTRRAEVPAATPEPTPARLPFTTNDRRSIAYGRNDCYLVDGQIECPLRAGE